MEYSAKNLPKNCPKCKKELEAGHLEALENGFKNLEVFNGVFHDIETKHFLCPDCFYDESSD